MDIYKQILDTAKYVNKMCEEKGEKPFMNVVGRDTAARILSIVYVQGGDERIVLSQKVRNELEYIQDTYHIHGSMSVDDELAKLVRNYSIELEKSIKECNDFPQWACDLFSERYGFKLYKP